MECILEIGILLIEDDKKSYKILLTNGDHVYRV